MSDSNQFLEITLFWVYILGFHVIYGPILREEHKNAPIIICRSPCVKINAQKLTGIYEDETKREGVEDQTKNSDHLVRTQGTLNYQYADAHSDYSEFTRRL